MAAAEALKRLVKKNPRLKKLALLGMRVGGSLGVRSLLAYPGFVRDFLRYKGGGGTASITDWYPCLHDRTAKTGFDAQYFYQAVWAMRHIHESGVRSHVDVGSQLAFVGMLTAVTDVTFVDIRPADIELERFTMREGTILGLPFESGALQSLSSLHVIEHIGLGRYGDPIDAQGSEKAARELQRVLAPGGRLYLSTPIGRRRVQFNSQRIFSADEIVSLFGDCTLRSFSVVDVAGRFRPNVPITTDVEAFSGGDFGLGMFIFERSGAER